MVDREPCPYRILDDAGSAFIFGSAGGTLWHSIGGYRNSPYGSKLKGIIYRVTTKVPKTAGAFGIWGILFASYDCSFAHIRSVDDAWNAIGSGALTGATLSARSGARAMIASSVIGSTLLATIEVGSVLLNRYITVNS